jgi:hypothetical protein
MYRKSVTLSVILFAATIFGADLQAQDTVFLKSGRILHGKVTEGTDEETGKYIQIKTVGGSVYRLDKGDSVKSVLLEDMSDIEYRKRVRNMAKNATAHMELAKWCEKQKRGKTRFAEEIRWHYENVIRFDPDHIVARRKLDYMQLDDGSWVLKDLYAARHGYVKDGNSFVPAIGAQFGQATEEADEVMDAKKIAFTRWLRDAKRGKWDALQLMQLCDETSVDLICNAAADNRESFSVELRRVFMDAIATVPSNISANTLVEFSIKDPDRSIREHAIALLSQSEFNHSYAVVRLSSSGLKASDNQVVNNAAFAIAEISSTEDYSREQAVLPLINALWTTHDFATGNLGPGRLNPSFGNGGTGLNTGGGPQSVKRKVKNQQSIDALRRLFEVDFGYDEKAWTDWYITNFTRYDLNVRSDK